MILADVDTTSPLLLQVLPQTPEGIPKDDEISSAFVRVYYIDTGVEVEVLSSTTLVHVSASKAWRYIWSPSSLSKGHYIAEYTLEDTDGIIAVSNEDIIVGLFTAPTVDEIDDKLSDEHGDGDWTGDDCPSTGKPTIVPGV